MISYVIQVKLCMNTLRYFRKEVKDMISLCKNKLYICYYKVGVFYFFFRKSNTSDYKEIIKRAYNLEILFTHHKCLHRP